MIRCTQSDHDALKADVNLFFERTTPIPGGDFSVEGLIYRNCACRSTLTLAACDLCGSACATGDALPWKTRRGDEGAAHFGCAVKRELERRTAKFVVHAGSGKARDFAREVR